MRTTLTLDDDVFIAVKAIAAREHKNIGEILSALARQAFQRPITKQKERNGIPLLPVSASAMPVTAELIHQLNNELP